jgi:cell division protein FtsB
VSSSTKSVNDDRHRELEQENAALRATVAALREDIADLRESALRWQTLYEAAIRRCAERDGEES